MMGEEARFTLAYGTTEIDGTPDNWKDVEMGITRDGVEFGLNRQLTSEFTFSGRKAEAIHNLNVANGMNTVCTINLKKRQDDWTYKDFNTFRLDFSTISEEKKKASIRCIENSVRQQISDNRTTEYDFTLPKDMLLDYVGVTKDRTNKMSVKNYACEKFSASNFALPSIRIQTAPSGVFLYDSNNVEAVCTKAATVSIKLEIGVIGIGTNSASPNSRIELVKVDTSGSKHVLTAQDGTVCSFGKTSIGGTINGEAYVYAAWYEINKTLTISQAFAVGERIELWWYRGGSASTIAVCQASNTRVSIVSTEDSIFQNVLIPIVTYKWAVEQVLSKIAPTASLTYNLPVLSSDNGFVSVLTSSSGLQRYDSPVITLSFDKLMKALLVEHGAGFDITGDSVTIDYPDAFFSQTKATDVIPINNPVRKKDTTHLYNKVKAGYETDENAINGTLEINCKNAFTIPNGLSEDKELDLIHPFKGSMYTIEQFMVDKDEDSTKPKTSDNDIFVFAVENIEGNATLYRSYVDEGNLPDMAYNIPISPMRLIIANGRYIGVSTYLSGASLDFASTDRKADYYCQLGYEYEVIYENIGGSQTLTALMINKLFKPETITFETGIRIQDLDYINANLYNYYEILDKNTEESYKFWIKDITLCLTSIDSQSWNGMIKI
jgi:hypothetical protein